MKGIILAGGTGTRMYPLTRAVNKQLLPVHDKPLIYYPLTTLISSGIREICIISNPDEAEMFQTLLGQGSHFGIEISYLIQPNPGGVAEAFVIAKDFIAGSNVVLILGDNIFVDSGEIRNMVSNFQRGSSVLGYQVSDPNRFGVVEFDKQGAPVRIVEKPKHTNSRTVIPGLYVYDATVCERSKTLEPSARGEIEISDLNMQYLGENKLRVTNLSRGSVWIDAGTPAALSRAGRYIATIEENHGLKIGCPEEAALRRKFIDVENLSLYVSSLPKCDYKEYLVNLMKTRQQVARHK